MKSYWIKFNNREYKVHRGLVMDMLTDEYLADRLREEEKLRKQKKQ